MYFTDDQHEANFIKLVHHYHANNDPEYKSACYILAVPEIWSKHGGKTGENPFDWTKKSDHRVAALSSAYALLVKLGRNLFNSRNQFNLCDALGTWGDTCFKIYRQAVEIRINRQVM